MNESETPVTYKMIIGSRMVEITIAARGIQTLFIERFFEKKVVYLSI